MTSLANCFHCGQANPKNQNLSCNLNGETKYFCCPGCQFAAEFIFSSNLQSFYKNRETFSQKVNLNNLASEEELEILDQEYSEQDLLLQSDENLKSTFLTIEGIQCSACCWLIEHRISTLPGVQYFAINSTSHIAELRWNVENIRISEIIANIQKLGYDASPITLNAKNEKLNLQSRQMLKRLGVAGLGSMQIMMFSVALYAGAFHGMEANYKLLLEWASLLIASIVMIYSATPIFKSAAQALKWRHLNMDVPIATALGLAYGASLLATFKQTGQVYFDSVCMFTFFITLGRYLEMQARKKASDTSYSLVSKISHWSTLLNNTKDGFLRQQKVLAKNLKQDDRILIKAGELVPVDATVLEGESSVNEALLSGEAIPISKQPGDGLLGGSQNIDQNLVAQVTNPLEKSYLSTLLKLCERGQQQRSHLKGLSEKIASYFIAVLLVATTIVGLYWYHHDQDKAFWIVLSMLVATCPCALSLALPTTLTTATATLTRLGVLLSGARVLETAHKITDIVFDKTGTLSEGKFEITHIKARDNHPDYYLELASALEQQACHPIATAFTSTSGEQKKFVAKNLKQFPNAGVEGEIDNRLYRIGSAKFIGEFCQSPIISDPQVEGNTIYLANQDNLLCRFYVEDRLREEAEPTLRSLAQQGYRLSLLTGDPSPHTYQQCQGLEFDEIHNNMSPQQKLDKLTQLRKSNAQIAVVGDGINDAPMLASADISIALASGADLTKINSDVVLLESNLNNINTLFKVAFKAKRIARENYIWAIAYNSTMLPLAAMGYIPPYVAAIGMSLSSMVVVLNALRLRSIK